QTLLRPPTPTLFPYTTLFRSTEDDSLPREVADWSPNPEQQYNQAELREILGRTIQGLPPSFRTVFVLRDVEGLSTEETADALDLDRKSTRLNSSHLGISYAVF